MQKLASYSPPLMLCKQHCSTENEGIFNVCLSTQCTETFQGNYTCDLLPVQLKNTAPTLQRLGQNLFTGNYTSAVVQVNFIKKITLWCFARLFFGSVWGRIFNDAMLKRKIIVKKRTLIVISGLVGELSVNGSQVKHFSFSLAVNEFQTTTFPAKNNKSSGIH